MFFGYMEKNVPAEKNKCRKGVFYHWHGKVAGEFQKHKESKSENFGVNCCNKKPMGFYVHGWKQYYFQIYLELETDASKFTCLIWGVQKVLLLKD